MRTTRTWNGPTHFLNKESTKNIFFAAFLCAILTACAESHSPNTEELVTVQPPTIDNVLNNGYITSPTKNFQITGNCDSTGYGMQYQRDDDSWIDFSPGCVNGRYSFNASLVKRHLFKIRSKSKFRFTASANVNARFVLPPTSPNIQWVGGGVTNEENLMGMQAAIPGNGIVPEEMSNGFHKLFFNVIGATYGK